VTDTTINSGTQYVYGSATSTTINGGWQYVNSGGVATSTTVSSGGGQIVYSGGSVTDTTINSGEQYVFGSATSTTLSGGWQYVNPGGVATSTTVSSGGGQVVYSGGSATDTTISSDGMQVVDSGGVVTSTTINSGGLEVVSAGGMDYSATIASGGTQDVYGTANGTVISGTGATQVVEAGGVVTAADISNGGTQNVQAGGTATGTKVSSGGTQVVASGSVVSSTSATSGGTIWVLSGAELYGTTSLDGGGVYMGTSSGSYTVDNLALSGGAKVVLAYGTTTGNNLTISNLSGSGSFIINTDIANGASDTITITSATGTSTDTIAVSYDPSYASGGTTGSATFATVSGGSVTFAAGAADYGAYSYTPTLTSTTDSLTGVTTWAVTALTANGASETAYTSMDNVQGSMSLWRNEMNHLTRRMGELRDDSGNAGEWVRVYSGQNKINDSYTRDATNNYTGIQGGYDTKIRVAGGTLFRGYSVGYMDSSATYNRASGKGSMYTVGAYGSWLGDKGQYIDVIVKEGLLHNRYTSYLNNSSITAVDGDYSNWGTSLSAEYGVRTQLKNNWYLEPQSELTASHITSADYTTSDGTSVHNQGINSLIGRLGITAGKKTARGTVYAQMSVLREFNASAGVTMSSGGQSAVGVSESLKDTWLEYVLGWTTRLNKRTNGYFEVSKTTGDQVSTPWQVNAGMRWKF